MGKIKERNPDFSNLEVVATLQIIGQIHHENCVLEEASSVYNALISVLKKEVGKQHYIIASILQILGVIYLENGETKLSDETFRQSKEILDNTSHQSENKDKTALELELLRMFQNVSSGLNAAAAAA